jgi:hypothetical protein
MVDVSGRMADDRDPAAKRKLLREKSYSCSGGI